MLQCSVIAGCIMLRRSIRSRAGIGFQAGMT
jgi:hypothetical protein